MTKERRSEERIRLSLPVRWDGGSGLYEARTDDVSLSGCFIDTTGRVELGEKLDIEINLPSGEWLQLRGEVVSSQPGIGFGFLFTFLTEDEESAVRQLVS